MTNEDKKIRVKLERHVWPDEIEEKREVKKKKVNEFLICFLAILTLVTLFFLGYFAGVSAGREPSIATSQESKLERILDILEKEWYFSAEFDDPRQELLDQALYGMTSNEVDLHTTYFSKEELEGFTQSINMNFVGIGVQYLEVEEGYIVEKVFRNSPAERAGVQAGDIFYSVDGEPVENLTTEELRDNVRGEKGTDVIIEFLRMGEVVELAITRDEVTGTAYAEMIDDGIGYLEITNFGGTTPEEVKQYLEELSDQGMTKLIIDLRDNGGGYLDSFLNLAGFFIGRGETAIQQQYRNGRVTPANARGDRFENIEDIVVLVNENTASASEVLAIALREQRDDVTIVGVTSYGKGTVQVTVPFADGSALKYTTSEWLSPYGTSINGVGIVPDVEVKDHDVFQQWFVGEEEFSYSIDQVSSEIAVMQKGLDYLGYTVSRQDGYYDASTEQALRKFKSDYRLEVNGVLDNETMDKIKSAIIREWNLNKEKDEQYQTAIEILKEK